MSLGSSASGSNSAKRRSFHDVSAQEPAWHRDIVTWAAYWQQNPGGRRRASPRDGLFVPPELAEDWNFNSSTHAELTDVGRVSPWHLSLGIVTCQARQTAGTPEFKESSWL